MDIAPPLPDTAASSRVQVMDVMREIWDEISPVAHRREVYLQNLEYYPLSLPEMGRLESCLEAVRSAALQVGSMPPAPPTLRGRLGAVLVNVIRRALFWYTPQLHSVHLQLSSALDEQMRVSRQLLGDVRNLHVQVAELKRNIQRNDEGPPAER